MNISYQFYLLALLHVPQECILALISTGVAPAIKRLLMIPSRSLVRNVPDGDPLTVRVAQASIILIRRTALACRTVLLGPISIQALNLAKSAIKQMTITMDAVLVLVLCTCIAPAVMMGSFTSHLITHVD
mmetsp:Transcript_33014/g.38358  ORF Transcript_33014/g.38358 Transcript_33014/m.38358 type:complete len:130 (-) Transcript_33014:920-1309(-)